VEAADRAGVDTVWVADHLLQADPTRAPDQTEMYEAYTVLGYAAAAVRHKLAVLARHCEEVGRPYQEVEKTLSTRLEAGEPSDQFARRCRAAAALGIQHVAVVTPGPWTPERLATLAAAIPQLREVQP
jgi:hypothetical protein